MSGYAFKLIWRICRIMWSQWGRPKSFGHSIHLLFSQFSRSCRCLEEVHSQEFWSFHTSSFGRKRSRRRFKLSCGWFFTTAFSVTFSSLAASPKRFGICSVLLFSYMDLCTIK
ncbi:hypothetical protein LINGRAHAP2_LOCUS8549 [Linum grandiflorum]